jgi:hypothetical protein
MRKTVRQTVVDFFEDKGVYDLYGREPGKLTYSDVLDLTDKLFKSEEFSDLEIDKETIKDLEDEVDMANASSEDYYDKLVDADYELGKLIDILRGDEFLSTSDIIKKLKDIREDIDV